MAWLVLLGARAACFHVSEVPKPGRWWGRKSRRKELFEPREPGAGTAPQGASRSSWDFRSCLGSGKGFGRIPLGMPLSLRHKLMGCGRLNASWRGLEQVGDNVTANSPRAIQTQEWPRGGGRWENRRGPTWLGCAGVTNAPEMLMSHWGTSVAVWGLKSPVQSKPGSDRLGREGATVQPARNCSSELGQSNEMSSLNGLRMR